ncbi:MAG: tail fiber domain-containing protein [Chromatiales bacterium]|nr:tail fiber domain-containing protein [Gammaproteobacteria bacterium]MCP5353198.1 tail fiber domain-containing protein [Chromatiales bacterium]
MGFIGDALGKDDGADAAAASANAQVQATQLGVEEMRRQYDETAGRLAPFFDAGTGQLAAVESGASISGLDQMINQIMGGGTFRGLIDERERAVQNQLSQTGLTRSGAALKAAAGIPTELALQLEGLLYGRQSNLAGSGQNAAAGLGAIGSNTASGIASLYNDQGQAVGQSYLQGAQADAQQSSNLVSTALAAAMFFSDERLKDNMEPIGELAGLTLYEWDWKPEVSPVVGQMSIGFSAQEVEKAHPDCVVEIAGRKAIAYPRLIKRLQDQLQEAA